MQAIEPITPLRFGPVDTAYQAPVNPPFQLRTKQDLTLALQRRRTARARQARLAAMPTQPTHSHSHSGHAAVGAAPITTATATATASTSPTASHSAWHASLWGPPATPTSHSPQHTPTPTAAAGGVGEAAMALDGDKKAKKGVRWAPVLSQTMPYYFYDAVTGEALAGREARTEAKREVLGDSWQETWDIVARGFRGRCNTVKEFIALEAAVADLPEPCLCLVGQQWRHLGGDQPRPGEDDDADDADDDLFAVGDADAMSHPFGQLPGRVATPHPGDFDFAPFTAEAGPPDDDDDDELWETVEEARSDSGCFLAPPDQFAFDQEPEDFYGHNDDQGPTAMEEEGEGTQSTSPHALDFALGDDFHGFDAALTRSEPTLYNLDGELYYGVPGGERALPVDHMLARPARQLSPWSLELGPAAGARDPWRPAKQAFVLPASPPHWRSRAARQ